MKDQEQKIHKKEIARTQLETATLLFLKGLDRSSVITLSGAAANILHQLVLNEGKKPFVDLGRDVAKYFHGEHLRRQTYKNRFEKLVGIIPLKHMGENCEEILEIDLDECALNALTYAMSDYITLYGQTEPFVHAFLNWYWANKDGPQIMEAFKNFPEKLKK